MSFTITLTNPSRRDYGPQFSAERTPTGASRLTPAGKPSAPAANAAAKPRKRKTAKKQRSKRATLEQRVTKFVERFEKWMHYGIAAVLGGIAIATMAYTAVKLPTSSHSFAEATSNAVAGVLIVLILIEITRTVITPPDSKGVAIRRLLMIGIMSALREVLWIGVNTSSGNTSTEIGKPLAMAISTIVVVGLAAAFVLVRRASGGRPS